MLHISTDCIPVDAFINKSSLKRQKSGEEKQIDRLAKNILRKRAVKVASSSSFHLCMRVCPSDVSSNDLAENQLDDLPIGLSVGPSVNPPESLFVDSTVCSSVSVYPANSFVDSSHSQFVDPSVYPTNDDDKTRTKTRLRKKKRSKKKLY